jgi:hypothetical protein
MMDVILALGSGDTEDDDQRENNTVYWDGAFKDKINI